MTSVAIDGNTQLKRASYQREPLLVLTRCGHGVQAKSFLTFENERCIRDSQRLWLDPDHRVVESVWTSSQYDCSGLICWPRSGDITYRETNPWSGIQHASRHTNRPPCFRAR